MILRVANTASASGLQSACRSGTAIVASLLRIYMSAIRHISFNAIFQGVRVKEQIIREVSATAVASASRDNCAPSRTAAYSPNPSLKALFKHPNSYGLSTAAPEPHAAAKPSRGEQSVAAAAWSDSELGLMQSLHHCRVSVPVIC